MTDNEYKCSCCGGIFEKSWPDDEAMDEAKYNFGPNIEKEDCEILCDECYQEFIQTIQN